jgi:hypothetical protein
MLFTMKVKDHSFCEFATLVFLYLKLRAILHSGPVSQVARQILGVSEPWHKVR